MTAPNDMRYLRENKLLKEKSFFQWQKWSTTKLQLYVIAVNKSMLYEFDFIGGGHHDFLNLRTMMRTPTSILTSYLVSLID